MASKATGRHGRRRTAMLLLALTLAFTLLGASGAFAITRATVLARAQTWIDKAVPYSQTHYYGGYRTDCSGYASMCWRTGTSWSTRSFYSVTSTITVDQLKPGDAMLKKGYHIRMFYGWVDEAHTMYVTYEQTGPTSKSSIKVMASDLAYGYKPVRYDHISNGSRNRNLLRNGSFDVWAVSRTTWDDGAVWWDLRGSRDATLTAHRRDVVKATRNSVQLLNPSTSRRAYTTMSQELTVTPETTYAVSAWAQTPCDPAGLEMSVAYLDAAGAAIVATHTSGDASCVDGVSLRKMSVTTVTPPDAVRALVTLRLAGGTTAVSATETVPGTSAVLDEISLVRPWTTIDIASNVGHSHIGQTATLSGSVTPTAAIGSPYVLYVQKPGSSERVRFHNHSVFASGSAAAWRCGFTFKKGMRTGVYRFKAELPAFGQYLGSATATVTVTLR
jgi:hypothetical protein